MAFCCICGTSKCQPLFKDLNPPLTEGDQDPTEPPYYLYQLQLK